MVDAKQLGSRLAALCGLTLLALAPQARAEVPKDELIVRIFDIGQGSCVLVECPDDAPILDDCGKMGSGGDVKKAAKTIRERIADSRATYPTPLRVVVSHPHIDHYSVITAKSSGISPDDMRAFYYAGPFDSFSDSAQTWIKTLATRVDGASASPATCSASARVTCLLPNEHALNTPRLSCGRARVDLLTASAFSYNNGLASGRKAEEGSSPNGESAVLRITYGGVSIVLPGDAEGVTQAYAAENAATLGAPLARTTVLLLPHHGSNLFGSNDDAWVAATTPRLVVASANIGGNYGHPNCDVLERFDAVTAPDQAMETLAQPLAITCGLSKKRPKEPRTLQHRFLFTEWNGDITIRISAAGAMTVSCEKASVACATASQTF